MSDSYWIARLHTAAARTSSNSGSLAGEHLAGQEHALAQAGLGDLDAVEGAELEHGLDHERGGEDDVAAARLDPGHLAALGDREAGERADELAERLAGEDEALDADVDLLGAPLLGGGQVADGATDADQLIARALQPVDAGQHLADVLAHLLELLLLGRPRAGEELLGQPHRAELERAQRAARGGPRPRSAACCRRRARARRRRTGSRC